LTSDPSSGDATRDLVTVAAKDAEAKRADEQAGKAAEEAEKARAAEEEADRARRDAKEREERARRDADEARRRAESNEAAGSRPGAVALGSGWRAGGELTVFGPFTSEKPELLVVAAFVGGFLIGRILKKITE
jgi:hypothetical protein